MTQPAYPDRYTSASIAAFPLPEFMPRMRREINPQDAINARQFEHWQTNGKSGINNRPDINASVQFYDMMPNSSRISDRNYRSQPRFDATSKKGISNPFFDKYDATFDSRNMTRELRASVYEDKADGYSKECEKLLQRNFDNRWLTPIDPSEVTDKLRPTRDDIRIFYH
jgi:hypothetical protein